MNKICKSQNIIQKAEKQNRHTLCTQLVNESRTAEKALFIYKGIFNTEGSCGSRFIFKALGLGDMSHHPVGLIQLFNKE